MKNTPLMILVIVLIILYWIGLAYYKKVLAGQITDAMTKGDQETYQKLLFSKRASLLLNPNSLCLMRGANCIALNKIEEAEKNLKIVRVKKLNFDQKITYYQTKSMLAMSKKDIEMHKAIQEELKGMNDEAHQEIIEELILENEINRKLYFEYDASVIEDLKKQKNSCDGAQKGVLCMSLAKAYRMNKQIKESNAELQEAKKLLAGSFYEELVDATIKDASIMD